MTAQSSSTDPRSSILIRYIIIVTHARRKDGTSRFPLVDWSSLESADQSLYRERETRSSHHRSRSSCDDEMHLLFRPKFDHIIYCYYNYERRLSPACLAIVRRRPSPRCESLSAKSDGVGGTACNRRLRSSHSRLTLSFLLCLSVCVFIVSFLHSQPHKLD